jgi:hypothetical protein
MKKDDLYIASLKYGKNNLMDGVTCVGLIKHLDELGYQFETTGDKTRLLSKIFTSIFEWPHAAKSPGSIVSDNLTICYMKFDAYFSLLEHEELQDARQSAKTAKYIAIIAIGISIIATLFSIHFSVKQISSPVVIQQDQFNKIENLKFDSTSLNDKIDKLIGNNKKKNTTLKTNSNNN